MFKRNDSVDPTLAVTSTEMPANAPSPPMTVPVPTQPLYTIWQILRAGIFGGPAGATFLLRENFIAFNEKKKGNRIFLTGLCGSALFLFLVIGEPLHLGPFLDDLIASVYWGIFAIACAFAYRSRFSDAFKRGAKKEGIAKTAILIFFWLGMTSASAYGLGLAHMYIRPGGPELMFGKYYKESDPPKAFSWFKQSAEKGNRWGQFWLADAYAGGLGVTQDYTEAAKWYEKAAERGDDLCQYRLGYLYMLGRGVPQDGKRAEYWYRRAANQGRQVAMDYLVTLYQDGLYIPVDNEKAYFWSRVLANRDQGYERKTRDIGAKIDTKVKLQIDISAGHWQAFNEDINRHTKNWR